MKKYHSVFLYVFYGLYFLAIGITSFIPKYFGEIGMSDSEIGIIMSVPGICGIFFQTLWGTISDRVAYKKNILIFTTLVGGTLYFTTGFASGFLPILFFMIAITIIFLPISPVASTIAIEHTERTGLSFGPIRMSGTIGYQLGALIVGFVLFSSLNGIFQIIGVLFMICGLSAFFLPPIQGHQHGKNKISIFILLKDKRLSLLLLIAFVACSTSTFYMTFFTKHLGDLGIDNGIIGIITVISVLLEIPFLFFSEKLYKKMSIWHWMIIGLFLNGVRWIGLGISRDVTWLIISNIPAVSIMACFEFFPALYINEIAPEELKGSAQSLLSLSTFGITKITGSLLGGFLSGAIGIPTIFIICGIILLASGLIFIIPCKRILAQSQSSIL